MLGTIFAIPSIIYFKIFMYEMQLEMAKLRVELNELKDSLDKAVIRQDFIAAQNLKMEVDKVSAEQIHLHEEIQREKAMITVSIALV